MNFNFDYEGTPPILDFRDARTMEELLQEPNLSPLAGAHEFHISRAFYEGYLSRGVCPMCEAGVDETEVIGIWRHAKPCGCRVGYAGKPIPQHVLDAWDRDVAEMADDSTVRLF